MKQGELPLISLRRTFWDFEPSESGSEALWDNFEVMQEFDKWNNCLEIVVILCITTLLHSTVQIITDCLCSCKLWSVFQVHGLFVRHVIISLLYTLSIRSTPYVSRAPNTKINCMSIVTNNSNWPILFLSARACWNELPFGTSGMTSLATFKHLIMQL